MNGLALRISRGGGGKSKHSIGFAPVTIPASLFENTGENNAQIQAFINSASTDDQLAIVKKILDEKDDVVIKFLSVTFLQAEAKHPVKCFISRYIIKNSLLQQPFTDALVLQIMEHISVLPSDYKQYVNVVSKVVTCIENFNPGVVAVRTVEVSLAVYLRACLECCMQTLREKQTLSPTEKNEIFNLAHLALRLLLHIIQKGNTDNISKLILMFEGIRLIIQDLMFDGDVPMDTKSVSGILYLSMHVVEKGPYSWIDVLNSGGTNNALAHLLSTEAARLCLYSAIATVVSVEHLFTQTVDDAPAIVTLTDKILDIGDRSSSESTFILGVSRTLLQISKLLDKLQDSVAGLRLVDSLLIFAWSHLEHYMDSVRHLTGQMFGYVVKYCAKLDREGNNEGLNKLSTAVCSLDRSRKSFYVSLARLAAELGARRVLRMCGAVRHVIHALDQPIHNTASTALETLLEQFISEGTTEELNSVWIQPIVSHVQQHALESHVLAVLESLLVRAFTLEPSVVQYIIPYIKQANEPSDEPRDLKCILMLLRVARKSGVTDKLSAQKSEHEWKGIISYDVLKQAAVDAVDETRFLSVSLIVESPKSTEVFTKGDLMFILYYLQYNINAQAPNFRQLTLSVMKKFIKRLEDSYKVIQRQKAPNGVNDKVAYYLRFVEHLRRQCFDSLLPGANYSRRYVALQVLVWCEQITLEGHERIWEPDYVEKLLLHLEDSYENNKAFALEVLVSCPTHLLKNKKYSISLEIKDIFRQASSLKPTDCVSAAYKLDFLRRRLPEYILQDEQCSSAVEPVTYTLVSKLLRGVRDELCVCQQSVVRAAGRAPVYGLLHCVGHVLQHVDTRAISADEQWTSLIADVVSTCVSVNAAVACVVNNSSPEGHLPMDMSVQITDHGNTGNVTLDDGRQVTAQMVLLCAWRSVKEVSLLLGAICSRFTISGEDDEVGTLNVQQVEVIGEHFTTLLAETKHRGAFEQAYVGFTKLLARLWRCRSARLHSLPRDWLALRMRSIASDSTALCATRRSAGLPFMIQALVTTELQVQGNPTCFHSCMSRLVSLCGWPCEAARTHALNILRALFRNAALDDSVAAYVGSGLVLALQGFHRHTWAERNSSTLLFSALMVRVFGVQRSRDADVLCVRNRMTGRIFFQRYPQLYDFMLEKLQEVSLNDDAQLLRPSLYPVLLLLARLYPSSLEGTVSNLKLVAYIPHVLACAKSSVLKTRQLAAKAIVPLISPEQYIPHIQSMFKLLHNCDIKRNYCHGILLQLVRILDAKPEDLKVEAGDLEGCVDGALWVLQQATETNPCYLITDEFLKVVNLVVWRFPTLPQDTVNKICSYLHTLIFHTETPKISPGRDICLSNAIYLYFILATKYQTKDISELVYNGLEHSSYEVVLSVLNYLLILHKDLEVNSCKFHEHLISISDKSTLDKIKNENYIQLLCKVLKNNYLECQQKSLKILMLEGNTQRHIIETKIGEKVTDEIVIEKLFQSIQNEHENLTHIYLESLLNFVTDRLKDSSLGIQVLLNVIRVVFECSSSDNCENTRSVVVGFIEKNIRQLLEMDMKELNEAERFELRATLWATIITLLEDDENAIRQRISDALLHACGERAHLTPCACACRVRTRMQRDADGLGLFVIIALLDFHSVVVVTDDVSDECRVFDQNERYNIFLEETVWTNACADIIINDYKFTDSILSIIDNPIYKRTFDKLCKDNVEVFRKMISGQKLPRNDALNPKIELFVKRLSSAKINIDNVCK